MRTPSGSPVPKWVLPLVGGGAALAITALVAPEILTGSVSDVGTFARVAVFGLAIVAWIAVVGRVLSGPLGAGVRFVPVAVALGWVLAPYVGPPTVVDEEFPVVAVASTDSSFSSSATTTAPLAEVGSTTSTSVAGSVVAAAEPTATTIPPTVPEATAPPTTTIPAPILVSSGAFQGLTGHRGEGSALVYDLADGSVLLRLEEIDIGSGPALEVYLVPGIDQRGLRGAIHVAGLKGEQGNQNYDVPETVDLSTGDWTVLVWCETFAVEVANATLA